MEYMGYVLGGDRIAATDAWMISNFNGPKTLPFGNVLVPDSDPIPGDAMVIHLEKYQDNASLESRPEGSED